ncbi:T9SS type A sorting domain-containing protein [Dysgonomonas sp. 25]|uniref:T9SS type A sorting domain-containing protein n=1 Tax=Dysgonomonas sp. 25 TaxID=2302933 RepID=UPI001C8771CA|nr:T9SS type A sorting domain-containing protein [Dysgonomonas sp. 25]
MKKLQSFLLLISLLSYSTYSFSQLTKEHNTIRCGDVLIKQQVEYIAPGDPGKSIIWNFTTLQSINDEYKLTYSPAPLQGDSLYIMGYNTFEKEDNTILPSDLIVGTEHNTMYYYQIKDNTLLLLGHENPVVKLQYTPAYPQITYPFNYGNTISAPYTTRGYYSGTEPIHTQGIVTITADAYGKMILPGGDTINPVLRIKTIQTIQDLSINTVSQEPTSEKHLETYRWYTKGYRYPIFETIRNIDTKDNSILFATSFYYPPQEHLYIDTDPDNQRILDEMWDINKKKEDKSEETKKENITNLIANYNYYPNPIQDNLTLSYELSQQAKVQITLYSIVDGTMYYRSKQQVQEAGRHQTNIDCHTLPKGAYVLQIITDNQISVAQNIIKK